MSASASDSHESDARELRIRLHGTPLRSTLLGTGGSERSPIALTKNGRHDETASSTVRTPAGVRVSAYDVSERMSTTEEPYADFVPPQWWPQNREPKPTSVPTDLWPAKFVQKSGYGYATSVDDMRGVVRGAA